MKERQPGITERTGITVRNVGIVVALIGVITNLAIFFGGAIMGAAGESLRRIGSNKPHGR